MKTQCFRLVKRDPWTGTRFETGHFRGGSEQVAARFAYGNTMLSTREAGPVDWDTIRNGTFSGRLRTCGTRFAYGNTMLSTREAGQNTRHPP